jgi:hypothetical protein
MAAASVSAAAMAAADRTIAVAQQTWNRDPS